MHQGKRCQRRTPTQTFMESFGIVKQKIMENGSDWVFDSSQLQCYSLQF